MCKALKEQLTVKEKWFRILYMLLFAIINYLVQFFVWALALFQCICVLFVGHPNQRLLLFTQHLTRYSFEIMRFLTYNDEVKPYPFSDWPSAIEITPSTTKEEDDSHIR